MNPRGTVYNTWTYCEKLSMDQVLVGKAVSALQTHQARLKGKGKPKLIDDDPMVSLIIALKKIPDRTIRPHRIPLAHTLYPPESTEMCLITKSEKSEVKSLLEEKKIEGVTKVIPIAKLKTNYKSYELKRRLSNSYDIFLTDKRLYHILPRLLGKKFFEKKKFPFPVDLLKKDLAMEIRSARDATYLHLGLGSCCSVPIGRVGFPKDHLVENVCGAMKVVASQIPRGWNNIQSIHIKSVDSISLPVFNSLPPEPSLLPPLGDMPPVKRVKLMEEETAVPSFTTGSDDHVPTTERTGQQSRKKLSPRNPKLSAKKIRGSTVISTKYEKALRGHRRKLC